MNRDKDSIFNIFKVVLGVSIFCSIMVAVSSITLRTKQEENKILDRKKNVLVAAGIYSDGIQIDEAFQSIEPITIDLRSGEITDEVNPNSYDMVRATKDPDTSTEIARERDIASLRRIPHFGVVYLLKKEGRLEKLILPISGLGLWSTLYGFISLEKDGKTVSGINFYEHSETPGLGGEVDNPNWQRFWKGKFVYDKNGFPVIEVVKGTVDQTRDGAEYKVDGISGATITARAVGKMVQFWMGDLGYGRIIPKLVEEEEYE
jgi:Na+-transporting NADH:ubiquinone oxidoreductase subunit C